MFHITFEVRDYECDMQGIVNNSIYLSYLEHTRHEFLKSLGLNFKQLTTNKIFLVVAKLEIRYRQALGSGDNFTSHLAIKKLQHSKIIFHQTLMKNSNVSVDAIVTVVATCNGKIMRIPQKVYVALANF